MEDRASFEFDGVLYEIEKNGHAWSMSLPKSVVPVRDPAQLDMLEHTHDTLVRCAVDWQTDHVVLRFEVEPSLVGWDELATRSRADKLRALINVGACRGLLSMGVGTVLHPSNILLDRNLRAKMLYRGVLGVMPPAQMDDEQFLHQHKALVLSVFDKRTSFDDLVGGAMGLKGESDFERRVSAAASSEDLEEYLVSLYDDVVADDASQQVQVRRRRYLGFKHSAIWLGAVAAVAVVGVAYYAFARVPFQERMLDADAEFVRGDYGGVIEALRPVDGERLPAAQLYELSYSYLYSAHLTEDQRSVLMNQMSSSSDPRFLLYWVHVGRGELEMALDGAKSLDDLDLILYSLVLTQEKTAEDPSLSGTEREAQLSELEAEYNRYSEARAAAVEEGAAAPTGGSSPSEPEAEQP